MCRPQVSNQADIALGKPAAHEPWSGGLEGNMKVLYSKGILKI